MGRTIPTATMLIQEEIDLFLTTYGKGLSGKHEKETLYDILQLCKKHTQACSQAGPVSCHFDVCDTRAAEAACAAHL